MRCSKVSLTRVPVLVAEGALVRRGGSATFNPGSKR
jgi:hypothetical protein